MRCRVLFALTVRGFCATCKAKILNSLSLKNGAGRGGARDILRRLDDVFGGFAYRDFAQEGGKPERRRGLLGIFGVG